MYTTAHYLADDRASSGLARSRGRQTGGVLRIVEVDSADDPRLADYTRLTDMDLRTHLEAEHGLFIAEGTKVITRAVAAGYPVRSVLLAQCRLGDPPAPAVRRGPGVRGARRGSRTPHRIPRPPGRAGVAAPQAAPRGRRPGRRRPPPGGERGPRRPRQRRGHLPRPRRSRRGRRDLVTAVRRSALPALGQGLDGGRVRHSLRAHDRLVRRPGRAAGGRLPAAGADPRP